MLVQFGNNLIQKIPLTAKLDLAYGLVQFWLSLEFFSSNYFQIGQHVVLLHILIIMVLLRLNLETQLIIKISENTEQWAIPENIRTQRRTASIF